MTQGYYNLPADLSEDIEGYAADVRKFLAGELVPGVFKAKRVPRGIYEQRQNGAYMVRVRIAGGALTAEQARVLAALGREYGDGQLHVTTRQDVQIHAVKIEDTPAIMRRLREVGLSSKGGGGNTVRNVAACPFAGVCPAEAFDVTPFAFAATEYLIPLVGSYNLPRKYKIAFSGCPADCALARANDLGFVASVKDGKPGFTLYAGGGMGARSRLADRMFEWLPATEVVRVVEAIRRIFDNLGDRQNRNRARLRFVFERLGAAAVREELLKQIETLKEEGVPDCGAAAEVRAPGPAEAPAVRPGSAASGGARLVEQHQEDRVTVPLHLPLGFVSAADLETLADIAEQHSSECGLRTTRSQDLLLRSVAKTDLPELASRLGGLDTDVLAPSPLEQFVACAGASTCRLGLCLARGAARACAEALGAAGLREETIRALEVKISGCPNSCGLHAVAPIGLFGLARRSDDRLVPSYRVVLGARRGEPERRLGDPVGAVPARALPDFLVELARDFEAGRGDGEPFVDYFERTGVQHFAALAGRHAAVPLYAEAPEFYRDWGQETDFSLAGRGAGECGAGVFEVIREDIARAKQILARVEEGAEAEAFNAFLSTVRALLITRGVDAADPGAVIRAFETHFVDTGVVGHEFGALLSRGRGRTGGWAEAFDGQAPEIRRLLERVELLFSTLDSSLVFHPPEAEEAGQAAGAPGGPADVQPAARPGGAATAEIDLTGVVCPMTFVKAKLKLETMGVGDTLGIVLDEGQPAQDVPESFRNEGQEVVELAGAGPGQCRLLVRKER